MALVGSEIAAWSAIQTAKIAARDAYITANPPPLSPSQIAAMVDDMEEAALGALFTHIAANAVVSTTVAVTSVSGVTPGGGISGPGAGTGTGTVG